MKLSSTALAILVAALVSMPMLAQTQIGGGVCNSSSLNGTYALSMSGRQVSSAGAFTSVLQADGSATFDGLSTVTIAVSENTNQAVGTSLNWSGTYSVQANCAAVVTISSGGSATLNVMLFNQGKNFLMAGNDATYSYTGNAVTQSATQPAGCSTATLSGAYTFNGTGFGLSTNAVNGAADGAGLLQFDGLGNVTANITTSSVGAASSPLALTGTYTLALNCIGSATLSDSSSHSYVMNFSIYSLTATNTNFYASLARSGNLLLTGGGHTVSTQPAAGTCSNSTLNGTYSLTLSGRGISAAGNFAGSYQGIGTATFDGSGNVTLAGTTNTNVAQGKAFSYAGKYSLPSSCAGTLTVTTTSSTTFTLLAWSGGSQFNIVGADGNYVYSGSGNSSEPVGCAPATLSGAYTFTGSGFTLSGTTQNGSQDEAGVLQFDGQGKVTATYKDTEGGATPVSLTATGTYTAAFSCLATATLADSSGNSQTLNFVIGGLHGETLDMLAASSQFVRTGTAHSAFTNPSQAIGNVASYAYSSTPPGSVFALFGQNLATRPAGAATTTLPTELLTTTVTVNGEAAPLFYVDPMQIDAQMPWDIPGNSIATVIVTNGTSVSNAAAIYVPATGTPGIGVFGNNRAVVVNANGAVNTGSTPAAVGDEVVAYFTGGGPVQASGKLVTGAPSPAGLSPVSGNNSVTVDGVEATVVYMGLTPGSIGLYQANFDVPSVAKGAFPVVITIAGQASNNPVMNVSN